MNLWVFKRLFAYAFKYKFYFFLAVFLTIVLAFMSPARVVLIGQMVDESIAQKQDAKLLMIWTAIIVGVLVVETILQFLTTYYSNLLAQSIIVDLRTKLFGRMLSFRMKFFDKSPLGGLVTRLVSDLEAITEVFSSGLMSIAGDLLMLFSAIFMMFYKNWEFSIYVLLPIPLLIFATRIFARAMQKSYQLERTQVNRLNTFVQERLTGMNLVQLFNQQDREFEKFQEINAAHREAHIKAIWANSIFFPVVEFLSSMSIALLYIIAVFYVSGGTQSTVQEKFGEITSFTLMVHLIYRPIRQLADKFNILQRGTVRAERVFETMDQQEQVQNSGIVRSIDFAQTIKFDQVSFAYVPDQWVIKNLSLEIPPGATVAFVGATGAGKSTIVNLLSRFYEYQKGHIYIGEHEIQSLELAYLRRNIAVVLQDVFLFSDSILNNITLQDPSISKEQVIEAAKEVGAHDFIMSLPGDYSYQVGERGGVLSSGQRQLLAFIRAFVYNPQILILDEATSSVDSESELLIQKATEKLTKGRTSIVIAHRLSTIQSADKIVVMEKGEIIEQGKHQELLLLNGQYKRLFDMQFGEVSAT